MQSYILKISNIYDPLNNQILYTKNILFDDTYDTLNMVLDHFLDTHYVTSWLL
jgi:hypothetical protein